jgi:hypothetical protein
LNLEQASSLQDVATTPTWKANEKKRQRKLDWEVTGSTRDVHVLVASWRFG